MPVAEFLGVCVIQRTNVGSWLYLSDLYRTMLHWRWYWIAIAVLFAYLLQFTLFGGVYTLLSDLKVVGENDSCPNRSCYCMPDITTFEEAFFFSVQTQITIGYGDMIPNPRCTLAIFAVIAQSMVGLTADAMLFGLIYQRCGALRSLAPSTTHARDHRLAGREKRSEGARYAILVVAIAHGLSHARVPALIAGSRGRKRTLGIWCSARLLRLARETVNGASCSDWPTCAARNC